ncbi:MAG: ribosomal protein S18-alanine N-acetyltransferase [Terracidiphilus sp.]|jgi:ribosomal-protein-alanine N-acetyltransferase
MNLSSAAVRVRRMKLADLDRVIEIAESLREAPQWPRSAYLTALDPEATPRRIALVAEDSVSSAVVGFTVASLLPPQAELETIAVAQAAQRRGLARRLFTTLSAELNSAQVAQINLEVRASNLPALGLYRLLGFAETGHRTHYYHDPVEDAVLMRLRLIYPASQARIL